MNAQVCVNCCNKKTVNNTDNRLVTESCGHVKCMDCLLYEKTGCVACIRKDSKKKPLVILAVEPVIKAYTVPVEYEELSKEEQDLCIRKLETAHIKVESYAGKKCYICTICKKRFTARSMVSYHAYCNGQKKPYHCQLCKQSFTTHSHYNYHLQTHSKKRTFTCDVCGMAFYQMSKLKRHTLKHTKEKNYTCNECSKAFNNLTALRKHARTHTEERPYACPACARRFRDVSNFKKHVDNHKKLCKRCGEEMACKGSQKEHRCEGRRGHSCTSCRKIFDTKKDLRRHAAIHTDSKPFRCKLCTEELRFRRKDNFERHVRNVHPDASPASAMEREQPAVENVNSVDNTEKIRLKILNPLPPLPQEIIQENIEEVTEKDKQVEVNSPMREDKTTKREDNLPIIEDKSPIIEYKSPIKEDKSTNREDKSPNNENVVDTKSIIEANNARESVIVEKRNADSEKKVPSPVNEYVHKIRKAIIPLPPIDQEKFRSVQRGHLPDNVTKAPITNVEIYKKILLEKDGTEVVIQTPKMHWRRKMEQDTK